MVFVKNPKGSNVPFTVTFQLYPFPASVPVIIKSAFGSDEFQIHDVPDRTGPVAVLLIASIVLKSVFVTFKRRSPSSTPCWLIALAGKEQEKVLKDGRSGEMRFLGLSHPVIGFKSKRTRYNKIIPTKIFSLMGNNIYVFIGQKKIRVAEGSTSANFCQEDRF